MTTGPNQYSIGLCYFRNLVARCYREARYLGTSGKHPPLERHYQACKLKLNNRDGQNGRTWVNPVFQQVRNQQDIKLIEKTFAERLDGLGLEHLRQAFADGIWKTNIGGKKWATIVEHTIALRDALDQKDLETIGHLIECIDGLQHNTWRVVEDFLEPCR
jgi:hypothetical protein